MDPSTPTSSSIQPPDPTAAGAAFPQNLDLSQLSSLDFSSMLNSFDLNNDIDLLSENTADLSVLSPVVSKPPSPSPASSLSSNTNNPQSSLSPRMLNESLKVTGRPRSHSVPVPPTNLDLTMSFEDDSDCSISPAAEGPDNSDSSSSPAQGASEKSKKRTRASPEQLQVLESTFMQNPSPSAKVREQLAQKVGMSERSIQIWFQNRRAKVKLMQKRRLLWQTQLWHNSSPIYPGALQMNRYMPSPRVPIPRASSSIVGYHPNMNLAATTNAVDDVRMFSAESLQVGGWRRVLTQNSPISPTSPPAGDLTCLYDLSTKSFTWTIADAGYRFKLVVPFVIVTAIHFRPSPATTDSPSGSPESELSFELSQPPNFFMSVTGADKSQVSWTPCRDFTEAKQASTCLIHVIRGSTQLLHSQLTTLLQAEPSLAALYRSHQANHASPEIQVNGLQTPPVLNRRVSAPPVPVDLSPNLSMMASLQANGNASVPTSTSNSLSVPSYVPLQQSPTDSQPASLLPTPVTSPVNNLETTNMVDPSQMGASMGLPMHNAVAEMRRMGRNRSASAPMMPSFRRAGNNLSAPNTPNPNHPLMASLTSTDLSQSAMSSPVIPTSVPAEMDISFDMSNANVFSPFPNVRSARPSSTPPLALNASNMSVTSPNANTSALSSTAHLDLAFSDKMLQEMAMSLNGQNSMLGGMGNAMKTDLAVTSAMSNNNEGTNSAGGATPSDLGLADNSLPSDLFGFNTGFGSQGSQLSGTSGSGSEEMDWNSLVGMIKFEGMSSISSA